MVDEAADYCRNIGRFGERDVAGERVEIEVRPDRGPGLVEEERDELAMRRHGGNSATNQRVRYRPRGDEQAAEPCVRSIEEDARQYDRQRAEKGVDEEQDGEEAR